MVLKLPAPAWPRSLLDMQTFNSCLTPDSPESVSTGFLDNFHPQSSLKSTGPRYVACFVLFSSLSYSYVQPRPRTLSSSFVSPYCWPRLSPTSWVPNPGNPYFVPHQVQLLLCTVSGEKFPPSHSCFPNSYLSPHMEAGFP
jgi:hypothetical protein